MREMQQKQKRMPIRNAIRLNLRALRLLFRHYPQMILSTLVSAIWNAVTPFLTIYLSALIVGELAGGRDPARLRLLVLITLGTAAATALIAALFKKWKSVQSAGWWIKLDAILTRKMLEMDYERLDDAKTSELLSTIRQNQNSGGWGLAQVFEQVESVCGAIFTLLSGIVMTFGVFAARVPPDSGALTVLNHPVVNAAVICVFLLLCWAAPHLNNLGYDYFAKYADYHNLANRLFTFAGFIGYKREYAADVRIYRQERLFDRYLCNKRDTFGSDGLFAHLARGPMGLCLMASGVVTALLSGVGYGFICLKAWAGAFGIGAVTQYVASVAKTCIGISTLFRCAGSMRSNAAFLIPVFSFLDIPSTMYRGSLTVEKRTDRDYEVEFRDVSFRYPGSDTYALRHVNMKFRIGKRLAVVGMNGSGKSTFIKLLTRLYDPTEGEITLNGIDIRKYRYSDYMSLFSVVYQDFRLFCLPIGENVAAGTNGDATAITACLDKSGFGERLSELPDGIGTYIGKEYATEGVQLSGGEAQKIAIARALYKNAPFMILDEPTAALDPLAEADVYAKFNAIADDKTAVYISHRLSSCRFCDEIAVFDHGSVIQQGSHDELVADQAGKYYALWHAQAQYYT